MTYNGNTRACYMSAALGNWNPCLGKKGEAIKGKGNIDDRHPSGGIPLLCSFMGQSPVRTCSIGPTTSFLLSMKMEKTRVKECRQHQDASRPSSSGRGVPLMPVQRVYCRLGESALTRVLLCGASVAVYEGSNKGTTLG